MPEVVLRFLEGKFLDKDIKKGLSGEKIEMIVQLKRKQNERKCFTNEGFQGFTCESEIVGSNIG